MTAYHRLLERQLKRVFGDEHPPAELAPLLTQIDEAYRAFDRDRELIERSMEISSHELLQANADIRAVLDGLVDLFLRIDRSGRILYLRGQTRHPILRREQELVGRPIQEVVAPDAAPAFRTMIERLGGDAVVDEFNCTLGAGDEARYYDVHCVPAHHHQASVIIRDITEISRATLREHKLQQRLALSERMESLGLLAGGVAHDLNNILSPLVSYPDIILAELSEASPLHRMIRKMQESALRGSAIIQDLLTLARRGNYQPEPVDLNEVIAQYLDSPEYQALAGKYPRVTLESRLSADVSTVQGSRHQLMQTVMNLVTNAFEAIEGGGRVAVSTEVVIPLDQVRATETTAMGPHILLVVQDTGIGIPAEQIDHIFEPFFTRKPAGKTGTGLGLSVVYGSVKDCGGTIKVRSTPGEGTTFEVYLPLHRSPKGGPTRGGDPKNPDPRGVKLLIVDDIPEQREIAMLLLKTRGFQVHAVSGGRQAVDYLRSHDADLILLDMIMEDGFDGLDTLVAIQEFKPDQPCLIVSGYAESDRVRRALDLGARGFVQKPFTLDILVQAVTRALEPVHA